jgi:leucyl-tRNA synthetase
MNSKTPRAQDRKWRDQWEKARVYEADTDPSKPKYLVTFPFPYMSGPVHVGTAYTLTRLDVLARYFRAKGYNVLFPFAWHWTGVTIAGISERIRQGDEPTIRILRDMDGVPEEVVKTFKDPLIMARYYTQHNKEAVKQLGVGIDWRREFHTSSDDKCFSKYVEWQYLRLRDNGYIKRGKHPVVWCPKDKSATGDHDRLEGEGVFPTAFSLVKFEVKDYGYLVAATFRPETVFGVTNVWLNSDATYVFAEVDGEKWVVSEDAARKLSELGRKVTILSSFKGEALIGRIADAPLTNRGVLVLPASFVDPKLGTGVVYSVPAHAPYDHVALEDLKKAAPQVAKRYGLNTDDITKIQSISIITTKRYGTNPSEVVVKQMGIADQQDRKLEQATAEVYREEFLHGVTLQNTGPLSGLPVKQAKEQAAQLLKDLGRGDEMLELPSPVICRCGTRCYVKILTDQYLLSYSDPRWKEKAKRALARMSIHPEEVRKNLEWFIDWYDDWAFVRTSGLGTRLPWDPDYMVETLSDSTIYMAYYIVAKFVNSGRLAVENLLPKFFDYVMLGKGEEAAVSTSTRIPVEILREVKRDFEYWYPVDLRGSGKDLVPNHLTFFIFHHTAVFPEKYWPKGITVNGFMRIEGEAMHKSKGIFVSLSKAVEEYGADATRLAGLLAADDLDDPDWKKESAIACTQLLTSIFDVQEDLKSSQSGPTEDSTIERWLLSNVGKRVKSTSAFLEAHQLRRAAVEAFYGMRSDIRWYLRRQRSPNKDTVSKVLACWAKLVAPFAPHTAEELWEALGMNGLVVKSPWPALEAFPEDRAAGAEEEYLIGLIEDLQNVLKVIPVRPTKVYLYVASSWKRKIVASCLERLAHGETAQQVLSSIMADLRDQGLGKEIPAVQKILAKVVDKTKEGNAADLLSRLSSMDELSILRNNIWFLSGELGFKKIEVFEEGPDVPDPGKKAKLAEPLRPSFYLE